jgi:hypothetical protein
VATVHRETTYRILGDLIFPTVADVACDGNKVNRKSFGIMVDGVRCVKLSYSIPCRRVVRAVWCHTAVFIYGCIRNMGLLLEITFDRSFFEF